MVTAKQGFGLATRIVFGEGTVAELPFEGRNFGRKVLLVAGKNGLAKNGILQRVTALLKSQELSVIEFAAVEPEPSLDTVRHGLEMARKEQADWVLGIGGGSAMDVAKTIAGLFRAENDIGFYFKGGKLEQPGLPFLAVPTTAGSGAEVTFNAVLTDPGTKIKQSIRDPRLAARIAIVDPELTYSVPETVTAHSGMDALVQAIEAYTSRGANCFTDIYAYAAIEHISANLLTAFQNGRDVRARSEMALGSLMAGIAFSNARLGAVHGLAHPVGIRSGKPHGLVCAVLLVPVMRFNLAVAYEKYAKMAKAFGIMTPQGDEIDTAAATIKAVMHLQRKLGIPFHMSHWGISEADLPGIIAESLPSGSLKANPREAKADDLMNILKEVIQPHWLD